ncbi:surface antigen-domain-containing protein [Blyttiomyces helicus]|uniref:Surface antigen-domain-containing protein n=1 Tax=Blyttiomyces helicus TaxID=388810 RepID=A0A4V1IRY8_9FUNG|nr:surface antigen-domain-containing protein [Blyttiomyces helicus]|eukprot:RKO91707.1 surface antigen-domain-containing protein [Blyttiomyces helicus]
MRVNSIRIEGLNNTRPSVVERIVKPILESQNLGDILVESQEACRRLARFGVFEDLGVVLDTSRDGFGRPTDEGVDVVLNVKEGSRLWARTGADVGNYEGNMKARLKILNAFGAGEILEANASYGIETDAITQNKDREALFQTGTAFQVAVYKQLRNNQIHSSHNEDIKGASARYKISSPRLGTHTLSYDAAWRQISGVAEGASWSVRKDAGHSFKSAVAHSFTLDRRDDSMLPTRGFLFKTSEEFAGLGGDVQHVKGEGEGQFVLPLGSGFSLSTSFRGGLLLPFNCASTRINDRFFLGGPLTIRGFRQSGVGPQDKEDAIGGDAYWAAGVSLLTPLPYLVDKPMKGHFFINGGSLAPIDPGTCSLLS